MKQRTVKSILALYAAVAVAGISIAGLTVGESRLALYVFSSLFGVGLLAAAAYDRLTRTPEPISDSSTRPSPWRK